MQCDHALHVLLTKIQTKKQLKVQDQKMQKLML